MKKNLFAKTLLLSTLSTLVFAPDFAFAATNAQTCELGNTCPIPGNDGGQTYFAVKAESGMSYTCKLKSEGGGSLKVIVSSGKDFSITQGDGIYNANPEATINIKGRFKKPDDKNDAGEIKFTKVPFSADGSVSCNKS